MSNTRNMVKCFLHSFSVMLTAVVFLSSCDKHEVEDMSWHSWEPGMVYTTNGEVKSYERCVADGNVPEAVLFYVDDAGGNDAVAYAVALRDCAFGAFSDPDTICMAQGTSADYNAFDGEDNTTILRYGRVCSPIVVNVGARYFIPSVAEMYMLYSASMSVNPVLGLCGGDELPVDDHSCWYWTSTECSGQLADRAWVFSLYSGRFESADKHGRYATRPVMKIRLNKAEQQ